MSDLISRQEAIEAIADHDPTNGYVAYFSGREVQEIIKSLPSADRPTGWIPVSERLPNRGKDVLVTRKYYGKDDCNKDSIYVEISACYADGEEWHGYSDEYKMSPKNHKVIAWMPLPEPYDCGAKMGGDSDG